MQSPAELDDYRWLVSSAAGPYLESAAVSEVTLVSLTKSLRRDLSAARTHLVLEQVKLRRRAGEKFTRADRLFFTAKGLEQSTDEQIARYKAARFAQDSPVVDLCCGVGGDLTALAARGPAIGVDLDPVNTLLAEVNCEVFGAAALRTSNADAATFDVASCSGWHIDPDRRALDRRVSRVDLMSPDAAAIDALRAACPQASVKLAVAAAPLSWAPEAELEWIGSRGECRQQVAWFGELARAPGRRSATIVDATAEGPRTIRGLPDAPIDEARQFGSYVYDPHAAVLAARLVAVLAAEHQLQLVSASCCYLTADHLIADPALAAFRVCEVFAFDVKRTNAVLRSRGIGRLEIKKRGVELDANDVRKRLRLPGDNSAVLLLARIGDSVQAILAERV